MMAQMQDLQDLVVIGGGSGGFAAAMRAAQLGGQVTVIEADGICPPGRTLWHPGGGAQA